MNVSPTPGAELGNLSPWRGGTGMGKKKKTDYSIVATPGFLTMLGDRALRTHFGGTSPVLV